MDPSLSFGTHPAWDRLAENGLNMATVFSVNRLPDDLLIFLRDGKIPFDRYSSLVLLGNGGALFWEVLERDGWRGEDPIDRFSAYLSQEFIKSLGGNVEAENYFPLYPLTDHLIPLQRLGMLAGWGHPSPVGPSISPRYGLWFAYRAAFLTNLPLAPFSTETAQPSPCDTCLLKPCQTVCPAQAVHYRDVVDLGRCIPHRLSADSSCRTSCLSRVICPVGTAHRYPDRVIESLYEHALVGIRAWMDRSD